MCVVLQTQCSIRSEELIRVIHGPSGDSACVLGRNRYPVLTINEAAGTCVVDLTQLDLDDRRLLGVVLAHQIPQALSDVMESLERQQTITLTVGHCQAEVAEAL